MAGAHCPHWWRPCRARATPARQMRAALGRRPIPCAFGGNHGHAPQGPAGGSCGRPGTSRASISGANPGATSMDDAPGRRYACANKNQRSLDAGRHHAPRHADRRRTIAPPQGGEPVMRPSARCAVPMRLARLGVGVRQERRRRSLGRCAVDAEVHWRVDLDASRLGPRPWMDMATTPKS